jgi:hypothetical protein
MARIEKKVKYKKVVVSKPKNKPKSEDGAVERAEKSAEMMHDNDDEDGRQALKERDFDGLVKQIATEYNQGWWFIKPKWDEWALRLKLYNNQKRDKEAVGDNTLFTIFQTVMASLYSDTLIAAFVPRESGDEETAENLDIMADYDHDQMEKDMLDYEWDFEAMFFGRGLMALMEYDREKMAPVPEVWNVMTVIRDPYAKSINGDLKGRGRCRFLGRELRMSKEEMRQMDVYFNFESLKPSTTSTNSLVDENMRITAEAAGLSDMSKFQNLSGDNETFRLLEWFTIWKGKRVFVTLGDDGKKVVRYEELDTWDIPLIDRVIYPIPGSWDGVSIPDLIEDKQRARAVATNLALKGVKSSLHPMYLFDETRIKNRNDLNFEFNKFVGVQGNPTGAVQVMPKETIKQDVQFILETLSSGAERSTASPETKQGARPAEDGSATRDALINQGTDARYSLSAKIFGWSEKRFWKQWYRLYKDNFVDGIDEKSVRITGALGAQWRPFTRENIIAKSDPDVKIESKAVSDAKRFNELQQFRVFVQFIATDPNANLRFAFRHMGKLHGLKKDIIDQLLPPTIEEMRANEENEAMRSKPDQVVPVLPTDDHQTHIEIHNKMEDTPAKFAHINAHKRAMMLMRARPDLFPEQQQQENAGVKDEGIAPANAGSARPVSNSGFSGRALPTA